MRSLCVVVWNESPTRIRGGVQTLWTISTNHRLWSGGGPVDGVKPSQRVVGEPPAPRRVHLSGQGGDEKRVGCLASRESFRCGGQQLSRPDSTRDSPRRATGP